MNTQTPPGGDREGAGDGDRPGGDTGPSRDPWSPSWIEEVVAVDGLDVVLRRPPDAEALIDEEAFRKDEAMPYWAELWPSALALSRALRGRPLQGRRVLELGCGLGLPSLVAALWGARVTATDWAADALVAVEANAEHNDVRVDTLRLDWREPAAVVDVAPWDLVLAADVLYEERNLPLVVELLTALGTPVLLADPGRRTAGPFVGMVEEAFDVRRFEDPAPPGVTVHELRPRR